jgi:biopolymer transport protein TolQ
MSNLEYSISWLATVASAAPFVGLFGTVWGIMNSFQNIGATGSANLAAVAPGISEALIATAIGLAAAIPAAIAYNWLNTKVRGHAAVLDSFSQDLLNLLQRERAI